MATIKCPNCGEEIEIVAFNGKSSLVLRDEKGRFVKNAGTDSYADVAKAIAGHNLCLNGIDLAGGETKAYKAEMEAQVKLAEKVRAQGHVKNHRLFRRWILAQLFQMIGGMRPCERFSDLVRSRGVRYMWRVIGNEAHDMAAISRNGDSAEFLRRHRWWNAAVVKAIAADFLANVMREIGKLKVRKCKGREYKAIPGIGMVFVDEIDSRVLFPVRSSIARLKTDGEFDAAEIQHLCRLMGRFKDSHHWKLAMPTAFINAFKGSGAYFGLRNLIMFHGCSLDGISDTAKALARLNEIAEEDRDDGWKLLGLFKETVKVNGLDMRAKLREWRKKED